MQHPTRTSITRRRLFGIGAATGAAVATGSTAAFAAPAGASAAGLVPDPGPHTDSVTPAPIAPGVSVLTIGYSAFNAAGTSIGNEMVFGAPASVGNTLANGWVHAPILLPAGSRIVRVDVVGYRVDAGSQTWNLYKTNLQGPSIGVTSLATPAIVTNSAIGEVQGSFAPASPVVVGIGETMHLELVNTSANNRAAGAIVQYYPAGGGFTTISPKRVYDSRRDLAGKLVKGATRTISVATEIAPGSLANVVPAGTRAIAYNVTLTDTESDFGYLTIVPGGDPTTGVSTINWDHIKSTIANGTLVGVNANRELSVYCDGTGAPKTHFLIDVVGYFV